MTTENKTPHNQMREDQSDPAAPAYIEAEGARGGQISEQRDLLKMLVAALLLTAIGVTIIFFWFA